jgi:hypothetical protein
MSALLTAKELKSTPLQAVQTPPRALKGSTDDINFTRKTAIEVSIVG